MKFERITEDGTSSFVSLKKINVNEKFFSSWSSAMAYVLGVICTDGNLNPGRIREPWRAKSTSTVPTISVAQKEPELLEKILHLMDCDAKLYFHEERVYGKTKAGALYHFGISNEKLYNDIVNLGLTPNKSLTMQFPNIPNEFVRHFIRGCWDGDGSVYIEKRINKICASFVSGSLKFVEGMISELVKVGFTGRTIHRHNRETPSYYFRFTGSQVTILYHYLYDNIPETEYLKRKFDLFRLSSEMNK
ncbi:MAG: LAGLIDADG family homing endonuclease [Smithellaceae bacterium]